MRCLKCDIEETESSLLMACDGCNRLIHKKFACSDLSASELRVIELKGKRVLKFFCQDCQSGLLSVPKLIKAISELKDEVDRLKSKPAPSVSPSSGEDCFNEMQNRQARINNLMIFNLPEGNDAVEIPKLLETLSENPPEIVKTTRIGKKNKNGYRSVKVTLSSQNEVLSLLKNRSRLKGSKVYINSDLTPNQREHEKSVLDELKTRKAQGEDNLHLRYSHGVLVITSKNH